MKSVVKKEDGKTLEKIHSMLSDMDDAELKEIGIVVAAYSAGYKSGKKKH